MKFTKKQVRAFAPVFRKAAERIDSDLNSLACVAIANAKGKAFSSDIPQVKYFSDVMGQGCGGAFWWPLGSPARVLGLLLCAELAKEGFIP